jgi:hypothetical protein
MEEGVEGSEVFSSSDGETEIFNIVSGFDNKESRNFPFSQLTGRILFRTIKAHIFRFRIFAFPNLLSPIVRAPVFVATDKGAP